MADSNKTATHFKKLFNPKYLGSYAFEPNKDLVLTVDRVVQEEVVGDKGQKEVRPVVYFTEDVKPLILNSTNAKMIAKIAQSNYIEDWAGQSIQLGVSMVSAFGDEVEAVRVRAKKVERKDPLKEG